MNQFPILFCDGYKLDHRRQYPNKTSRVLVNWTPRTSRINDQDHVISIGFRWFIQRYLVEEFKTGFFDKPVDEVSDRYLRRINGYLGPNTIGVEHIRALHAKGYLPLNIRGVPEGTLVPVGVPILTVENTDEEFFWLPNYIETLLSCELWLPLTSATTAVRYRRILEHWAKETGSPIEFVDWQGHDFSMRGMQGVEAASASGMAHLLFFTGTDTLPAIDLIEEYYGPITEDYLIGGSVTATEHSVMCAGGKETELDTFRRLLRLYPEGILSVVSDTWDLWNVVTNILPQLRDEIMARNGKLVIRPDSGDPVKIICGDPDATPGSPEHKGVIELLWEIFGGSETVTGHRILDEHIGCIYGDGITEDRMWRILEGLAAKGFASANMVFGLGSFTYTYVTRDTYGQAMKATWCEIDGESIDIFKDPVTDDGGKRSASGRLAVLEEDGSLVLVQQATPEQEAQSLLQPIWVDGGFLNTDPFPIIRERARANI